MTSTDQPTTCGQPTLRDKPCVLPAAHPEPNLHHAAPDPGGFCHRHWSWLCQAGQGQCQTEGGSR